MSVTPSSGTGSGQTFSFLYSDPNGFADLLWAQMAINATLNGVGACYTHYVRGTNALYLAADNGTTWLGPVTPGVAGTMENSQCIVNVGGSSTSGTGTNLTVTLALTFKQPAFNGLKNIYMRTQDVGGLASGWQTRGTWTVGNSAPTAVSVTPSSGSGSSQTFSFLYSDPNGFADLVWGQTIINATLNGVGACYTHYVRGTNRLYLANDDGATWLPPLTPGIAGAAENSQCLLNAGGSSTSGVGTNLTVTLALTFKPAFNGLKNIYMRTQDVGGLASGWQTRGTWTVGTGPPPLTITTTSPLPNGTQGVAYSQTLAATGGATPYNWTVGAGLPPGLSLSTSGVVSGTPSTAGTYNFTVQVTGGGTATKAFSLTVAPPLTIITSSPLPSGTTGVSYSQSFAASGGTTPYTWSLVSGELPPWMTLSSGGVLSGTTTTDGSYTFTVQVSDSGGRMASRAFSLEIALGQGATDCDATFIFANSIVPVCSCANCVPQCLWRDGCSHGGRFPASTATKCACAFTCLTVRNSELFGARRMP